MHFTPNSLSRRPSLRANKRFEREREREKDLFTTPLHVVLFAQRQRLHLCWRAGSTYSPYVSPIFLSRSYIPCCLPIVSCSLLSLKVERDEERRTCSNWLAVSAVRSCSAAMASLWYMLHIFHNIVAGWFVWVARERAHFTKRKKGHASISAVSEIDRGAHTIGWVRKCCYEKNIELVPCISYVMRENVLLLL